MRKLQNDLCREKLSVFSRLEATEIHKTREVTELLPDFDLVSYGGLDIKDYPIWHHFDLKGFTFLHCVRLEDFGYVVDDETDELPKFTSGSGQGGGHIGDLKMDVQAIDRFGCRIFVRGKLLGSSVEMNMDVAFDFLVAGFRGPSNKLGFAAEALAEGFAFENERRLKQAFFSYFSALDSFLESEREMLNRGSPDGQLIRAEERLHEKLAKIVKRNLPSQRLDLNDLGYWGELMSRFKLLEKRRNAIAHNQPADPIGTAEVDQIFAITAILVAMIKDLCFDEKDLRAQYGI